MELVAARLGDEVEDGAAGVAVLRADAGSRNLHFLERVDSEIRRRDDVPGVVGAEPVERCTCSAAPTNRARCCPGRSRTGVDDAGHDVQDLRVLPLDRHLFKDLLIGDVDERRVAGVDERRVAGDGERFLHLRDQQLAVDRQRLTGQQDDPFPLQLLEASHFERDGVGARRQVRHPVRSLVSGRRRLLPLNQLRARQRDDHARQAAAIRVNHLTENRAGDALRVRECRRHEAAEHERQQQPASFVPRRTFHGAPCHFVFRRSDIDGAGSFPVENADLMRDQTKRQDLIY